MLRQREVTLVISLPFSRLQKLCTKFQASPILFRQARFLSGSQALPGEPLSEALPPIGQSQAEPVIESGIDLGHQQIRERSPA